MIRKYLLAGLFTLLPLVVTLWILKGIFNSLLDIFRGPLTWAAHLLQMPDPPTWGAGPLLGPGHPAAAGSRGRPGGQLHRPPAPDLAR